MTSQFDPKIDYFRQETDTYKWLSLTEDSKTEHKQSDSSKNEINCKWTLTRIF